MNKNSKIQSLREFSKTYITDVAPNLNCTEALYFKQKIAKNPEEAIYIYSFSENRMIYADGWEEVLGYKDEEINMILLMNLTSPLYAEFSNELYDKALLFLLDKTEDLEQYSINIEIKKMHKKGNEIPLIVNVGVFKAEDGKIKEIIGRYLINRKVTYGKVMQYAFYGPDKSEFEAILNKQLVYYSAISKKEKEALSLVAKGYSFKEIASLLKVSQSAIEKRILPMYKRFDVKSLTHLVSFAYDNNILP